MELALAKEFIYRHPDGGRLYVSKSLDKVLEATGDSLIGVFAVIDTPAGERTATMCRSYSGEPMIDIYVGLHKESFLKFNNDCEIINL